MSLDIKVNNGDWSISPSGDFNLDEGFGTTIELALFTDARADSSEVLQSQNRRGWAGNLYLQDDDNFGSKLWIYDQSRLTNNVVNGVSNDTNLALNFFLQDNLVREISTETTINSLSSLESKVTISRFNSPAESLRFTTWEKT